jgi:tRNA pseudouridine55 synthase
MSISPDSALLNGVILVNKPATHSSQSAVFQVRKALANLLHIKPSLIKAGHTGTLDPTATGLLPVCLGHATKVSGYGLVADKSYVTDIQLGITTTTGDHVGEVVTQTPLLCPRHEAISMFYPNIQHVLATLHGVITQTPSMYSALKHQGRPLYAYAREGVTLDVPSREVTIYQIEWLNEHEWQSPIASSLGKEHENGMRSGCDLPLIRLRVSCSKGTYIRSLAETIGQALVIDDLVLGAHLTTLHRETTLGFDVAQATPLSELMNWSLADWQTHILPLRCMLPNHRTLNLSHSLAIRLLQGQRLSLLKEGVIVPEALSSWLAQDILVQHDATAQSLAIAHIDADGVLRPKRVLTHLTELADIGEVTQNYQQPTATISNHKDSL